MHGDNNNKYYLQIFGTAIRSPLSPILADIVLERLIGRALYSLKIELHILKKYVDDMFLAVPENLVDKVLAELYSHEERLQFTVEKEQNQKLAFLDTTVSKTISSGRMLNFYSFHQLKFKINVANNIIHRVSKPSHGSSQSQIKSIVHSYLQIDVLDKQATASLQ